MRISYEYTFYYWINHWCINNDIHHQDCKLLEEQKPRNKVRFFIIPNFNGKPYLYIKDINGKYCPIVDASGMIRFGLNVFEFLNMPPNTEKEVFLYSRD